MAGDVYWPYQIIKWSKKMGTRSSITVKHPDTGKYHNVYCHWDGYTTNNGALLVEHYNKLALALSLVSEGDISSLAENCNGVKGHDFNSPAKGQTVYYTRDRGEADCTMREFDTYAEALERNDQEYNYLFDNDKWYVSCHSDRYSPVETILTEQAKRNDECEYEVEELVDGTSILYATDL
jgi:hypothetical protein